MRWNRANWYRSGAAPKYSLKIDHFLFVIRDYLIRNHRQIGIPIV
ncbi:MAG: hypothetical protein SGI92_23020 [Bryobacteraceae bacterium]|nr:hypothetical protein [Bryobacteraceae bacterium]